MTSDAEKKKPLSVRQSLAWSFAKRYTNMAMTIPTIMIVSRLLTPEQVGVYSVGMAFVTLIHSLRDFGVSDYLVRTEDLDDRKARSAFTINLIIAWVLGCTMFLASGVVATFYSQPGLELLLKVISINFFLLPFGSTVTALLKRSMQFGISYQINLFQQATQSGSTIVFVLMGFGFMGLAMGSVAGTVANILACMYFGRNYRIRGLGLDQWRDVSSFGIQRVTGDVVSRIGASAPDFIIARVIDFASVGLYSRGKGLVNLFRENILAAVGVVTFPTYARDFRRRNDAHLMFLKSMTYVTGVSWPFFMFSALMGFPIMRIMFGDQWDAAVPILQWIAMASVIGVINMDGPQLLTAIGHVKAVTRTIIVLQIIRIALLVGAAFYSLEAVAAASVVGAGLNVALYQALIKRYTPIKFRDIWFALTPSVLSTVITMVPPLIVVAVIPPSGNNLWVPLIVGGMVAGVAWLVGLNIVRHPLSDEINTLLANAVSRVRRTKA
ncbi:oligosaccharide flippase family protein [Salinisphaera sp. T31B1]|uniref:oligosaccharide flippase family protein n=1 Tax=Salinisphaera sp. T31B1 TaxID=727963 RepID=UPI00333E9C11